MRRMRLAKWISRVYHVQIRFRRRMKRHVGAWFCEACITGSMEIRLFITSPDDRGINDWEVTWERNFVICWQPQR